MAQKCDEVNIIDIQREIMANKGDEVNIIEIQIEILAQKGDQVNTKEQWEETLAQYDQVNVTKMWEVWWLKRAYFRWVKCKCEEKQSLFYLNCALEIQEYYQYYS